MKPMDMPRVMYEMIALKGGLDQVTPTLSLKPGVARDCLNFECSVTGGYSRIAGYERYDGQPAPSSATYVILTVALSAVVATGDTVTGVTSTETGVVIASGADYLILTAVSGPFTAGETLNVGGSPVGTVTTTVGISPVPRTDAIYTALAASYYRTLIDKPPGSGPVRGVVYLAGVAYAFRNNAGGTAVDVWKSSASGWTAVPLYKTVSFTVGAAATPADGETLTQGAVTATVKRVCMRSGAWTGTAAGTLVITTPSGGGGHFAAGAATLSGGATVTLSGVETSVALAPDGRFSFVIANFGVASRAYGADGKNKAFEFDGDVLAPITTGMTTDTPKHVAFFKNYLFLGFGPSLQFSGIGAPFAWTPILGAGEINLGEDISNLIQMPGNQSGGAMLCQTRNGTQILYGSASPWQLVSYNVGTGGIAYTAANLAGVYTFDDRGIIGLNATLAYGNFDQMALTANLRPFTTANRQYACAAAVNREKSQYRTFFSNGYGLYATIVNDKYMGSMPVYFPDPVFCIWEGEDSDGNEITLVGSEDGYVYQLDKGTSFDGTAINAYLTLNYDAIKGPRMIKRFRKMVAEITGTSYVELNVNYSLGYGSTLIAPQLVATYASSFANALWDASYTWDSGIVWDGRSLLPSEMELQGSAENISVTISSNSDYAAPYTINSLIMHFTPRRGLR